MAVDFEVIHQALFDRLVQTLGADIEFSTRKPMTWDDIPPGKQPALVVLDADGTAQRDPGCPSIWTIHPEVILYVHSPNDREQVVATTLNALVKKIDVALKRRVDEPWGNNLETTLGLPNVDRCWRMDQHPVLGIEDTNGQSLVSLTIEIVVNDFE